MDRRTFLKAFASASALTLVPHAVSALVPRVPLRKELQDYLEAPEIKYLIYHLIYLGVIREDAAGDMPCVTITLVKSPLSENLDTRYLQLLEFQEQNPWNRERLDKEYQRAREEKNPELLMEINKAHVKTMGGYPRVLKVEDLKKYKINLS